MSNTVISVENLTKRYDLGVIGTGTLSRDLNRWWARLRGQPDPYTRIGQQDHFERIGESILALDDVSFKVEQGEALGIIGRNGAGKSTLLKILSRVTAPTSGVAKVKGRIGSLLEVGTGFHPELTGRENVYLNGAILGMRKEEVEKKFDEIVDFSGVEKFIDTPVKRYSSGMYVRLAFAVAAHLDPEILVVDEVLAVGDAEFQKKCLGKMGDVAGEGRTVLFVSHNMDAIQRLCKNAVLLKNGKIEKSGNSSEIINHYLKHGEISPAIKVWKDLKKAPGNESIKIHSVRVINEARETEESLDIRKKVGIEMEFRQYKVSEPVVPVIALYNAKGQHIFNAIDTNIYWNTPREEGSYTCIAWIPGNLLNEERYYVTVALNTFISGGTIRQAFANEVVSFQVFDPLLGDSAKGNFTRKWEGAISPLLKWSVNKEG